MNIFFDSYFYQLANLYTSPYILSQMRTPAQTNLSEAENLPNILMNFISFKKTCIFFTLVNIHLALQISTLLQVLQLKGQIEIDPQPGIPADCVPLIVAIALPLLGLGIQHVGQKNVTNYRIVLLGFIPLFLLVHPFSPMSLLPFVLLLFHLNCFASLGLSMKSDVPLKNTLNPLIHLFMLAFFPCSSLHQMTVITLNLFSSLLFQKETIQQISQKIEQDSPLSEEERKTFSLFYLFHGLHFFARVNLIKSLFFARTITTGELCFYPFSFFHVFTVIETASFSCFAYKLAKAKYRLSNNPQRIPVQNIL